MHVLMIAIHAAAGIAGFALGVALVLRPAITERRWTTSLYLGFVAVLVAGLTAAIVVDWTSLVAGQRLAFLALGLLGGYTLLRAWQGRRVARSRAPGWRARFVDHVGFTLISLWDGFVVVLSIDLGAPLPVVVLIGIAGVVVGVAALRRVKASAA